VKIDRAEAKLLKNGCFISKFSRTAAIMVACAVLAGCATPEARLRAGLLDAGLSQRQSGCMAGRMVDRLSVTQLRRIGSLAGLKDENARDLSLDEFLYRVRALSDTEILAVATRSAAVCALGG